MKRFLLTLAMALAAVTCVAASDAPATVAQPAPAAAK